MGNNGSVSVCSTCYSFLKCQWKANEETRIPQERREYTLPGGRSTVGGRRTESDEIKEPGTPQDYFGGKKTKGENNVQKISSRLEITGASIMQKQMMLES